jgi:general secretion pathway protein D
MKLSNKSSQRYPLATLLLLIFAWAAQPVQAAGNLVTMDFQDVDLRQVVRFVAEVTGKNIVIDPRVKGQVSVITPGGVTLDEAYSMFEVILTTHGFSIQESKGTFRVIPAPDSKVGGGNVTTGLSNIPEGEKLTIRIVRLKEGEANGLLALLRPLMHPWGLAVAHPPSNALIIADTQSTTKKLLEIIKQLDIPADQGIRKLIPLHHAQVAQVEKVVNGVYADFNSRLLKGKVQVKLFADLRTNTLIVVSPKTHMKDVSRLIMDLDRKNTPGNGNLHIYYPKNAKAETISKVLNDLLTKVKGGQEKNQPLEFLKEISVVADADTNMLLVAAEPEDYELLMPVIAGLDIKRKQVIVEALILELTMERAADFGVNWNAAEGEVFLGSDPNTLGTSLLNSSGGLASYGGLRLGVTSDLVVGGVAFTGLGALAKALEKDVDTKVVSSPVLITLDNEKAEISDVQDRPVPKSESTANTADANTVTSFDRKEFGIKFSITPQILEDNRLLLNIYQEQSAHASDVTIGSGEQPVFSKRSIDTKVMLQTEQTVVLGGLIKENEKESVHMVPCIGGVQGVGDLFRNTGRSNDRSYMMVFIRPTIINDYNDLVKIGVRKFNQVNQGLDMRSERGSSIIPKQLFDENDPTIQTDLFTK